MIFNTHHMKSYGASICVKCYIVNYSNQIYDVKCLLYPITLYKCDGAM